ncbi:hypothetical protein GN958_ATG13150, partial [Phytophthora infestans]
KAQHYHARKQAEEPPLEYLHRLSVAGQRAKLCVKSSSPVVNMSDTLFNHWVIGTLIRRKRLYVLDRQGRALFGTERKEQALTSPNRLRYASDRESSLSGAESDNDLHWIYLTAVEGKSKTKVLAAPETDRPTLSQTSRVLDRCQSQQHGRTPF